MGRCETDVAFRVIVGEDIPDFRRIAEFRLRHLERMQALFLEVLALCRAAGLVKVGRLALEGTKVKANASRHKAMSYDRMTTEEERLKKEIDELLAKAPAADESEDEQHGSDARGDEFPDELKRRADRLKKIQEAKAALEEQARQKAAARATALESKASRVVRKSSTKTSEVCATDCSFAKRKSAEVCPPDAIWGISELASV